jgi:hypothetical protein
VTATLIRSNAIRAQRLRCYVRIHDLPVEGPDDPNANTPAPMTSLPIWPPMHGDPFEPFNIPPKGNKP